MLPGLLQVAQIMYCAVNACLRKINISLKKYDLPAAFPSTRRVTAVLSVDGIKLRGQLLAALIKRLRMGDQVVADAALFLRHQAEIDRFVIRRRFAGGSCRPR